MQWLLSYDIVGVVYANWHWCTVMPSPPSVTFGLLSVALPLMTIYKTPRKVKYLSPIDPVSLLRIEKQSPILLT